MSHDTPEAIAITDKAAQDLMLSELLKVCTTAPWVFVEHDDDDIWKITANNNSSLLMDDERYLPSVPANRYDWRLIALAPTIASELIKEREINAMLLEALKGVVKVADRATMEFDAARAAIAKAEGTQA
jgi:hypothetical protein